MGLNFSISPENKGQLYKSLKKSFLGLRRMILNVRQLIMSLQWRKFASEKTIDWGWDRKNYNRIALVNKLISKYSSPSYLEIGCASNTLFNAVPAINKIGVDPCSGGNVRMTSDDYFSICDKKFDVVFIDGLHTYSQVRRDIQNALNKLNSNGWIALHDMLPGNWIEQHVPVISTGVWTGDVWKVAFELIETKGLEFKLLKIDHGVGVIRVLEDNLKLEDRSEILESKDFNYFYTNLEKLPTIEWDEAQEWLNL